jgi:hypothetical protein
LNLAGIDNWKHLNMSQFIEMEADTFAYVYQKLPYFESISSVCKLWSSI